MQHRNKKVEVPLSLAADCCGRIADHLGMHIDPRSDVECHFIGAGGDPESHQDPPVLVIVRGAHGTDPETGPSSDWWEGDSCFLVSVNGTVTDLTPCPGCGESFVCHSECPARAAEEAEDDPTCAACGETTQPSNHSHHGDLPKL